MPSPQPPAGRDARGRFLPGCSGNPAGKAPGTLNHATRLKALLRDGEAEEIGRVIIARAVAGDAVAGRFLFDRLDPKPRGRPIELETAGGTLAERFAAVFAATAEGRITPDEALLLGRLLDLERRSVGAAAPTADAVPEPLDADAREAAAIAKLRAVFGKPTPSTPSGAADSLHSPCISRPPPPPDSAFSRRRSQAGALPP
ncbi:MAG: DUF5681 domain-containing protein [Pseudomonadota bacterium]